jgi:hypothetical protein
MNEIADGLSVLQAQYDELLSRIQEEMRDRSVHFKMCDPNTNHNVRPHILRLASIGKKIGKPEAETCLNLGIGAATISKLKKNEDDINASERVAIDSVVASVRDNIAKLDLPSSAQSFSVEQKKALISIAVLEVLRNQGSKNRQVRQKVAEEAGVSNETMGKWIKEYGKLENLDQKEYARAIELENEILDPKFFDGVKRSSDGKILYHTRLDLIKKIKTLNHLIAKSGDMNYLREFQNKIGIKSGVLKSHCWQNVQIEEVEEAETTENPPARVASSNDRGIGSSVSNRQAPRNPCQDVVSDDVGVKVNEDLKKGEVNVGNDNLAEQIRLFEMDIELAGEQRRNIRRILELREKM